MQLCLKTLYNYTMNKLTKEFFIRDTLDVARELIGKFLVRETPKGRIIGRINETEAYIGRMDKACHAYNYRKTPRNEMLFHEGGVAYVYLIYGLYYCLNTVTEAEGEPSGVLQRGVEIIEGHEAASFYRYGKPYEALTRQQIKNFSNGPGKLGMALDIDKSLSGMSLQSDSLYICDQIKDHKATASTIIESKRIGIDYAEEAVDFLWRFNG